MYFYIFQKLETLFRSEGVKNIKSACFHTMAVFSNPESLQPSTYRGEDNKLLMK